MIPSQVQRFQLPPLKDLEGVAGPLYGTCLSQHYSLGARLSQWDSVTFSRAHTPLSPPLECSSGFDIDSSDQTTVLSTRPLKIADSREQNTTMSVPLLAEKSAGGWFDPKHWLFQLVHQRVGAKSIEELIKLIYYREARPRYGEDHTSTRAKKSESPGTPCSGPKQSSSDAHKQQEQDRRWRHRTLQYEMDECTGTYVCEAAEQMLPLIKETINQMSREEFTVQETDRKVKRLGKDEQLTAAALLPHISSILIFKLYDTLEKARCKSQQKENDLQREREIRMNVQYRLSQLERENEALKDKLSYLERQPTSRKRSAASMEDNSAYESDQAYRGAKRYRFELVSRPEDRLNRCHLPLSPQSDGDEFATSSHVTSFSSH